MNVKVNYAKVPTKKERHADLTNIAEKKRDLDFYFNKLDEVFGTVAGGDFHDCVYWMFEAFHDEIAKKHKISAEDMSWFVYDLDCGNESETVEIIVGVQKQLIDVDGVDNFMKYLAAQ